MPTTSAQRGYQTVFKVNVPKSHAKSEGNERIYHARRSHSKSRGGCLSCKQAKVKCDERKPRCIKCNKTGALCVYKETNVATPVTPDSYNLAFVKGETDLEDLLSLNKNGSVDLEFSDLRMLHHFQTCTSYTVGAALLQGVFRSCAVKEAWGHDFLMHTILSVSAMHLSRLHKDGLDDHLCKRYTLASAQHWQKGLQLYQKALKATQHDFTATISATFLTVMQTFTLEDDIPEDALFNDTCDIHALFIAPLASTGGFGALSFILSAFDPSSPWIKIIVHMAHTNGSIMPEAKGIDDLPPALVRLCDLDSESTAFNSLYHKIVRLLSPLLALNSAFEHFGRYVTFCARTWQAFKPLVAAKDARGLLLLAYWYTAFGRVGIWWVRPRAKATCAAIVAYLSKMEDQLILDLLEYPASGGAMGLERLWEDH